MHLSTNCNAPNFSTVYIERTIVDRFETRKILEKLKPKKTILIDNYAEVFNRNNQSFLMQKQSTQCILAEKKYDYYYDGSPYCENFGAQNFYYTSPILNCLYDCGYCYLKALYPCAHLVIFINNADFIRSIENHLLQNGKPVYLALSYDTDLLALEGLTGFIKEWFTLLRDYPNLTVEIKTKANIFPFITVPDNLIFAWSLLPQELIDYYEPRTPSLIARLKAAATAQQNAAQVRLSFEPLLPFPDLENRYREMVALTAQHLDFKKIRDMNIGGFRISSKQFKHFVKSDPGNPVLIHPTVVKNNAVTFSEPFIQSAVLKNLLTPYFPEEKIHIYG